MKKVELEKSSVYYDPIAHTYTRLDGLQIPGITGRIKERLFPNMYACPPHLTEEQWQAQLGKAAERGHAVHNAFEAFENGFFTDDCPELDSYQIAKAKARFECVCNEFVVSDTEELPQFASPIDAVYMDEQGAFHLVDFKTNAQPPIDSATWQLAYYWWAFEKQTDKEVQSVQMWWFRLDKHKAYDLTEQAREKMKHIPALLYLEDAEWEEYKVANIDQPQSENSASAELLTELHEAAQALQEIESEYKKRKAKVDELKEQLIKVAEIDNVKGYENAFVKFTYIAPRTSSKLDEKRVSEYLTPEQFAECQKTTTTKASARVTLTNQ